MKIHIKWKESSEMRKFKVWLKGLIAAGIGGGANAVTVTIVDPNDFNFGGGFNKVLQVAAVSAVISVAMYLKAAPVWED